MKDIHCPSVSKRSFWLVRFTTGVLLLFAVGGAKGQNGSQFKDWTPPTGEHTLKPKASCASLLSLTNYELSIVSAVEISATSEAPEHCRVQGQISPEIRFEVDLPSQWNQRLYMFGNGGFAGEPPLNEGPLILARGAFALGQVVQSFRH
jgi:feruloyl esterase